MTDWIGPNERRSMFDKILVLIFLAIVFTILTAMIAVLIATFGLVSLPVLVGIFAVVMVLITLFD